MLRGFEDQLRDKYGWKGASWEEVVGDEVRGVIDGPDHAGQHKATGWTLAFSL